MLTLGTALDGAPLTLDSKALTTHGFILGMTGSGKTGLAVVLVEELLREGIPLLAVDSKGDLATLLLSFDPADPQVDAWAPGSGPRVEAALQKLGMTREQFAAFHASYQPRLYTPGSSLGLSIDLLGSLAPPADAEAAQESADGLARSLLGLLGIDADPISSREYLLLVQLLTNFWNQSQTPTLVDLLKQVASPPFATVGALPLEDFFPAKDRQALMVRLNALLASPKFTAWRQGEALDPGALLRAPDGRPRLSIYSVAHLSDEERIFAVAQLLERTQSWMRKQGGASCVRAVLLIDEIFGYFPPAPANPPTKPPLLSLLKQARAFGLSVVLATQNPIDLDYRGLSNIGTWLIGRLQSDQDKARIRDALVSAAASTGVTPAHLDELISKLEPRKFLLHSIHRPAPQVFASRDSLTLLRGPFSADELKRITAPMKNPVAVTPTAPTAAAPFIDPELGPLFETDTGTALPYLLMKFGVRYRVGTIASEETMHEIAFPLEGSMSGAEALEGEPLSVKGVPFQATKPDAVTLSALPAWASSVKAAALQKSVKERLPAKLETKLWQDPQTKLVSSPMETLEEFSARVVTKLTVNKDTQKVARDLEKKRADLAQAEKEVSARKAEKWMNVGTGVLGLFTGRSRSFSGVSKAMASNTRQGTAESKVEDLRIAVAQLEQQLSRSQELDTNRFTEVVAVPKPADVQLLRLSIAWIVP